MPALTPDDLFRLANMLALAGWLCLALGVALGVRVLSQTVAGLLIPAALSLGYTVIVAVNLSSAEGGFATLDGVASLFRSPWVLLAGWIHYLAFDLLIGGYIARDCEARGLPRWLLAPVLPLVFLLGPAGFLLWLGIRTSSSGAAHSQHTKA